MVKIKGLGTDPKLCGVEQRGIRDGGSTSSGSSHSRATYTVGVRRLLALTLAAAVLASSRATAQSPALAVDWPVFLARQDLVWSGPPASWEEGAPLGNGLIGAMAHADGDRAWVWELGRADVIDRRTEPADPMLARPRLPVGRFRLETAGAITGGQGRLGLWDAEFVGALTTTAGTVTMRSFVHATEPLLVVELDTTGTETDALVGLIPDVAINTRRLFRKLPIAETDLNPAPFVIEAGAVHVSVQPRTSGGEYAVAWSEQRSGTRRVIYISIADSYPGNVARNDARAAVERAAAQGVDRLRASHRAFWHAYYPASFVSLPDARLESFYWIQMYKLASATRANGPVIDNQGPWYRRTPWPGLWWNLNVQLSYWPTYAANRATLAESVVGFLARNESALRANVPERHRGDTMAISRASSLDGVSPILDMPPSGAQRGAVEISNLVWVLHDVWLHWRHTMDAELLRTKLFPWLRAAVNAQMAWLTTDADGRLHFPQAVSPEYPDTAPDTNYDLSLLRWGCHTLLDLDRRLGAADPLAPRWRDTLVRLADYPVGANGYLIGRDVPFAQSHRHFSHLLMVYPLRLVTGRDAAQRALVERSLAHWIGFEGALQGYSFVGASAISSLLGEGDDAVRFLDTLIERFVKPNTMYMESGPVMETPLAAAQAIHELLLQGWGGAIRVFPALPTSWRDVAFHDLRAEGGFSVSAIRRDGEITKVHVTSLAGEPATLHVGMTRPRITAPRPGAIRQVRPGEWQLSLRANESVTLVARDASVDAITIRPVTTQTGRSNAFGRH